MGDQLGRPQLDVWSTALGVPWAPRETLQRPSERMSGEYVPVQAHAFRVCFL